MNRKTNKESYSIRKKSFIYLCTQIEADLENLDVKNKSLKVKILKYKLLKQQTVTLKNSKTYLSNLMDLKQSLEHKTSNLDT